MTKFLLLALCAYVLWLFIRGDRRRRMERERAAEERPRESRQKPSTGVMVKDPVCGAYVSVDTPIRVKDKQGVHAFCSYECRDEYLKSIGHDPEQYRTGHEA